MASFYCKLASGLSVAAVLAGCSSTARFTPVSSVPIPPPLKQIAPRTISSGKLGPVLTSAEKGAITGWDVDAKDNYGLLSAGYGSGTRLEVFDLKSATIVKLGSFQAGAQGSNERQFVVLKILANKLALVDDINFNTNTFERNDTFPTLSPASGGIVTGTWTPPQPKSLVVQWVSYNQTTTTNAMFVDDPNLQLLVSNVGANSFQSPIALPTTHQVFETPNIVAQDTAANIAVVPTQLFNSSIFDPFEPPSFDIYNYATQTHRIFSPNVGSGAVQGIAIDSTTHMMCTTTAEDSNVEFYDLRAGTGFAVNLPNGGGEGTGGGAVAVDELHHLFIVTQPAGELASASVYVYDESGTLREAIGGFDFSNRFAAVFAYVAVNPTLRIGYVSTATADHLRSFTY